MPDQPVNEELVDQIIRHQVLIERFKHRKLRDLRRYIKELRDDVAAQIARRGPELLDETVSRQRLEGMLRELEQLSDRIALAATKDLTDDLRQMAEYEANWVLGTLQTTIPVAVETTVPAAITVWAAVEARPFDGRLLQTWVQDYTRSQRERLTGAVRMAVVEGQTVDQTVRRIIGTKSQGYKDGIIDTSRRGAEALARTAINHTVTMARQETFNQNESILKGVQWKATLDGRTSEICRSRDGRVYEVTSGPRPPAHPNCRSTMVPVTKSWRELGIDLDEAPPGTRASMNGQVSATLTYGQWLKRQPVEFQDDVLGVTKGKLFREGGLSIEKLADENLGRGLTLAELRRRNPDAFRRAGL